MRTIDWVDANSTSIDQSEYQVLLNTASIVLFLYGMPGYVLTQGAFYVHI